MIKKLVTALIRFYQLMISPWIGPRCRFTPTCSEYTLQSFRRFSSGKALWYSVVRISKCHPLCEGGHDPLPKV